MRLLSLTEKTQLTKLPPWQIVYSFFKRNSKPEISGHIRSSSSDTPVPAVKLITFPGITVYLVDGGIVKETIDMDFVEGGNDQAYQYIPNGQIWLDWHLDWHELPFVLWHELTERDAMLRRHMKYNSAHKVANKRELTRRKSYPPNG